MGLMRHRAQPHLVHDAADVPVHCHSATGRRGAPLPSPCRVRLSASTDIEWESEAAVYLLGRTPGKPTDTLQRAPHILE